MKGKIVLSFLTIFITLVSVEIILTLFYPIEYLKPLTSEELKEAENWCFRASEIVGLDYEPKPNNHCDWRGTMFSTGKDGERLNSNTINNSIEFTIAALGNSMTFGSKVNDNETYCSVLERLLSNSKVLNFSAPGYSTKDEAIVFSNKVIKYDPNALIIGYFLNDPETSDIHTPQFFHQPKWWQHSNILRAVSKFKLYWDIITFGEGLFWERDKTKPIWNAMTLNEKYVFWLHDEQSKFQTVTNALNDIQFKVKELDIEVILLIIPVLDDWGYSNPQKPQETYKFKNIHKKMSELGGDLGFEVIDLFESLSSYELKEIRISDQNGHPNPLGHKIITQTIFDFIMKKRELNSD